MPLYLKTTTVELNKSISKEKATLTFTFDKIQKLTKFCFNDEIKKPFIANFPFSFCLKPIYVLFIFLSVIIPVKLFPCRKLSVFILYSHRVLFNIDLKPLVPRC